MMDENLIGYALNALDADDHRRTEEYLRDHPEAKRKLELVRAALKPLESEREFPAPPAGLVDRTMARVSEVFVRRQKISVASRDAAYFAPNRWRRMDVLVACSVLILLGGLGTSGLARLKHNQDRIGCQNNLRQYHEALTSYAQLNNSALPMISDQPPHNKSRDFARILRAAGFLAHSEKIDCPASPSPSADVNYAYHLPYRDDNNQLHGIYRDPSKGIAGDTLPVMADLGPSGAHSPGFNVLYNGGHVRFSTDPNIGIGRDDIFHNLMGQIAAGRAPTDSVLAPPDYPP